jgi:GNAT superfamily N-acetyltransferase
MMAGMACVRRARFGGSEDDSEICRTLMREYAAQLNASAGGEHICVTSLEEELAALPGPYAEPAGAILLAFVDDEPAGCVALKPVRTESNAAGQVEMKRLWVRPAHQGRGLGRTLAQAAMDLARDRGYFAMVLDTMPRTMQSAYALYRAMGFEPLERGWPNPVLQQINADEIAYLRKDL